MNVLTIDTKDREKILIGIKINEKIHQEEQRVTNSTSQLLLLSVEKLLKENKLILKNIDSIEINPGPGSYTGLRIGFAVANALSFSLGIKVSHIEPVYNS